MYTYTEEEKDSNNKKKEKKKDHKKKLFYCYEIDFIGQECTDTDSWIEQRGRCLRRKTQTNQRAPLVPIVTSSPLELVCTLEKSKG